MIVRLSHDPEDRIATFPIEFLRRSGDNTWSYIYRVIVELICVADVSHVKISDDKGCEVDHQVEPSAGSYFLSRSLSMLVLQGVDSQVRIRRWSCNQARNISQRSKPRIQKEVTLLVRIPSALV